MRRGLGTEGSRDHRTGGLVRTAVITIVSGRHDHLERQQGALDPDVDYIVVAMNDPALLEWRPTGPSATVIPIDGGDRLPLAAARNLGAARAIERGAELLVFLDVDCIPGAELVASYAAAATDDRLLTGAVGYLPEGSLDPADAHFHGFRPRPDRGEIVTGESRLFWSLSFASTLAVWTRIGGFDETYLGYGGEDTDFALRAGEAGLDLVWVGGAEAVHQYHPTQSPPVQHLHDILVNGAHFAKRWGFWPMQGWLVAFEERGLVERDQVTGEYTATS